MFGGEASHLPLKINTSGVIPPIFASSLLLMPVTIASTVVSGSICTERTMPSAGCGGRPRASRPGTLLISLFSHTAQCTDECGRPTGAGTPAVLPRQESHSFLTECGRYGTAASMPGILQDADLQIRIPAHWAGRGALIHESVDTPRGRPDPFR